MKTQEQLEQTEKVSPELRAFRARADKLQKQRRLSEELYGRGLNRESPTPDNDGWLGRVTEGRDPMIAIYGVLCFTVVCVVAVAVLNFWIVPNY